MENEVTLTLVKHSPITPVEVWSLEESCSIKVKMLSELPASEVLEILSKHLGRSISVITYTTYNTYITVDRRFLKDVSIVRGILDLDFVMDDRYITDIYNGYPEEVE